MSSYASNLDLEPDLKIQSLSDTMLVLVYNGGFPLLMQIDRHSHPEHLRFAVLREIAVGMTVDVHGLLGECCVSCG